MDQNYSQLVIFLLVLSTGVNAQMSDFCDRALCPDVCCCRREGSGESDHVYGNCTHRNLREIPRNITPLVTFLDLGHNSLGHLPAEAFIHLPKIRELSLLNTSISSLDDRVFRGLRHLNKLVLQLNNLSKFPTEAFRPVSRSLKNVLLDHNAITDLSHTAFDTIPHATKLTLDYNRIDSLPVGTLHSLPGLHTLSLANNRISKLHAWAFTNNSVLKTLNLARNWITYIADYSFHGLSELTELRLNNNPIKNVESKAFVNLPSLTALHISDANELEKFPDLNGTCNLREITLNRCRIKEIPKDFCCHMKHLTKIDFHSNMITDIPDLSGCSKLEIIDLKLNQISSLKSEAFASLAHLIDLTLKSNHIKDIPGTAFQDLAHLHHLDLSYNKIETIHQDAFKPLERLEHLNLASNFISRLPSEGLSHLVTLQTPGNKNLVDIPPPDALPQVTTIVTTYGYHCCLYRDRVYAELDPVMEQTIWLNAVSGSSISDYDNYSYIPYDTSHDDQFNNDYSVGFDYQYSFWSVGQDNLSTEPPPEKRIVTCEPLPGPFLPCDDIFESWYLRIPIWLVFLLAVVGNITVIGVILSSRSKIDVPRFLIINLASADLAMGLYLGLLAGKDAATLGVFRKTAVQWQLGSGCKVAGFLAVFSSELSIYTLTTITLERFYAIKHAVHLEKRLKLRWAAVIMAFGWVFSITIATLPLLGYGINEYRYAVCLPLDVGDTKSLVYVATIMVCNALAFVIILLCYTSIYCSIQGSHAWNSNDSRVARRMSLLVFTDFICWAPFALFALASAFGNNLIPLEGSKVLIVFVLPVNSCANPFLYTLFTKQFKKDCRTIWRRVTPHSLVRRRSLRSAVTISVGRQVQGTNTTNMRTRHQQSSMSQDAILADLNGVAVGERIAFNDGCESTIVAANSNHRPSFQYQLSTESFNNMLSPELSTTEQDNIRRGSGSPLIDKIANGKPPTPKTVQTGWSRFSLNKKFQLPFRNVRKSDKADKDVSMHAANCRNETLQNFYIRQSSGSSPVKKSRFDDLLEKRQDSNPVVQCFIQEQEDFGQFNRNENNDSGEAANDLQSYRASLSDAEGSDRHSRGSCSRHSVVEEAEMCQLLGSQAGSVKGSRVSSDVESTTGGRAGSVRSSDFGDDASETSDFIYSDPHGEMVFDALEDAQAHDTDDDVEWAEQKESSFVSLSQQAPSLPYGPIPSITIEHLSPVQSRRTLNTSDYSGSDDDGDAANSGSCKEKFVTKETRTIISKESTV